MCFNKQKDFQLFILHNSFCVTSVPDDAVISISFCVFKSKWRFSFVELKEDTSNLGDPDAHQNQPTASVLILNEH